MWQATFRIKVHSGNGNIVTISGIPYDTTYTVTEPTDAMPTGWHESKKTGDTGTISGTASQATFTNAQIGSLVLDKDIANGSSDSSHTPFTFRVTLENDDANIDLRDFIANPAETKTDSVTAHTIANDKLSTDYTESKIVFDITVADNTAENSRTIPGIPYGTKYTVEEVLSGTTSETATITNANAVSLTLSKAMTKVNGDPTDLEEKFGTKTFTFTVTLTNGGLTLGDYTYTTTFSDDAAENDAAVTGSGTSLQVTLRAGQSVTIGGIPKGTTYQIVEDAPGLGWKPTYKIDNASTATEGSDTTSGHTIADTGATVQFINVYQKPNTSALNLKKEVTGHQPTSLGTNPKFIFSAEFTAPNSGTFTGYEISYKINNNGTATNLTETGTTFTINNVYLQAGDTLIVEGLPQNTTYSVTEDPNYYMKYNETTHEYDSTLYSTAANSYNKPVSVTTDPATPSTTLNGEVTVIYKNNYPIGSLKLVKHVTSASPTSDPFTYRVTLNRATGSAIDLRDYITYERTGEEPNYTYKINDIVVTNVTYNADKIQFDIPVNVSANKTTPEKAVLIENIPAGTTYTVVETDKSGWREVSKVYTDDSTDSDNTAQKIASGETDKVTITNAKTADLVLNEVLLNGKATHSDDKFTFTVTFVSPDDVEFSNDYFTFKDKDGHELPNETFNFTPTTVLVGATPVTGATITAEISENIKQITISGVPYGTVYSVTQNGTPTPSAPQNSEWKQVSVEYSDVLAEGETEHKINAPTQSFTAKNAITGGLQISKTTAKKSSPIALPTEQFTFNLTLSNIPAGISLDDFVITAKDSSNNPLTVNGTGTNRTVTMTMTGIDTSTTTGTGTITVIGIPQDVKVTVTEATMLSANWEQTAHSNDTNITIGDNVGNASTPASFTNTYTPTSISLFKKDSSTNAGIPGAKFYLLKLEPNVDIEDETTKDAFANGTVIDDNDTLKLKVNDVVYATVVGTLKTTGDGTTDELGMITLTADNSDITFSTGDKYFFFEAATGTTLLEGNVPVNYIKDNTLIPEKVIEIKNDRYIYSVEYSNERVPTSTGVDITKKGDDGKYLGGAVFDLWYENTTIPKIYTPNDPFSVPSWTATKTVKHDMSVPNPADIPGNSTPLDYEYEYKDITVPSSTDTEWILPRSDNDYIYFRDYNEGTIYDGDYKWNQDNKGNQQAEGSKRRWINTWFDSNDFGQRQEIFYDHRYWVKAVFTAPGKETKSFAVWERFVDDSYSDGKTVVWKIQPPDGYKYVEFILCDGDNHVRNTEKFEYVLGNIYTKTNKGRYDGGQYGYPVKGEHWSTNWQGTGNSAVDKRQNYSSIVHSSSGSYYWQNTDNYVFNDGISNNNTSSQTAPKQTERYTPTEQKIVFHCNSKVVWHNIHIEFFTEGTQADHDFEQVEGSVTKYYKHIGQGAPGYLMEPYAYAGDDYRINGYLTYELTIPKEATHFRVNNGVTNGAYYFRSEITKLHTAEDRNGRKNYGNYFKIADSYRNVSSSAAIKMTDWTSYPTGSGKDSWNESYSNIDVSSDYDYVYFRAPSNWGSHIYAYFYAGGELQEDNWQRAVYSIWPGEAPVGSEYDDGTATDKHSDIYGYSYEGTLYATDSKTATPTNPESTFSDGGTIYKFRIPKGDRTNYKKVIFNNGLTTQLNGVSLHQTSAISYHAGYLYNYKGESDKYYENKPTSSYQKRGNGDDYIYIKVPSGMKSAWDNMHITFYDSNNTQILQQGDGYVMEYSGKDGTDTYYRMAIPTNAAKFALNNGFKSNVKTKANEYYDIPRLYDGDDNAMDYTKNRAVYEMSGSGPAQYTLNLLGPKAGIKAYLYVRVEDPSAEMTAWSGMHATFYNADDEQVPDATAGSDFTLTDAGTMEDGGTTYRYFRTKIPDGAKKFNLYNSDSSSLLPGTEFTVSSSTPDRVIYTLAGTPSLTAETTNTVLPEEQAPLSGQSDHHDYTIRGTDCTPTSHDDYLYIRDDANWNIGIGYGKVKFYDENGTLIRGDGSDGNGTYTLIKTDAPVWYEVSIPQNAKTFTVSYASVTTQAYDIYPYGAEGTDGNHTETGNMYYQTESGGKLSLIASIGSGESTTIITKTTTPTAYNYTPRPKTDDESPVAITDPVEYLYLVCENKNTWDGMTVTFDSGTVAPSTPEYLGEITYDPVSPVGGVSTNDPDAVGHWFRIPIPDGATSFTATNGGNTATGTIFEWRSKPTRYAENWTTDGMQYRLPDNSGKPTLLYPVFTEEELQSVEVGGQTIYAEESVKVDLSQIEDLTGATPAQQVETENGNVTYPVLYQTDSDTVKYTWEGGDATKIYFDNSITNWDSVKVYFFDGHDGTATNNSYTSWESREAMSPVIGTNLYEYTVPTRKSLSDSAPCTYYSVIFTNGSNSGGNNQTEDIDLSSDNFGKGYKFVPDDTNSTVLHILIFHDTGFSGSDNRMFANFKDSSNNDLGSPEGKNLGGNGWNYFYIPDNAAKVSFKYNGRSFSTSEIDLDDNGYEKGYECANNGTPALITDDLTDKWTTIRENEKGNIKKTGTLEQMNSGGSATYQPEDRYGYITTVTGTDDRDNFIYINTGLSNPTIHFYTGTNGDTAIDGADADISLKYNKVNTTDVTSPTNNQYFIRLPRNATKFVLKAGDKTVTQDLYENGFHHAGTTFTVANDGTVTKTTRNATRSELESDVSPRTDGDYVFFTDTDNTFLGTDSTVYAYFYGDVDGEYTPWPGVKASTTTEDNSVYTDSTGQKVYKFRIPKGSNGKYSKVIFTDGVNNDNRKITKAMNIENGKNYVLGEVITDGAETDPQHIKYGGFSSNVYDVTTQIKASGNTENYSGTKSIYIINNGTQDSATTTDRTKFDEIHITFYDANKQIIGTANPGYLPDKLVSATYTEKGDDGVTVIGGPYDDIYRITVPSSASYFQINNGINKGTSKERYSVIEPVVANGLYKFVEDTDTTKLVPEGSAFNASDLNSNNYMLKIVNKVKQDDDIVTVKTEKLRLARVVTDDTENHEGKIKYIQWLKPETAEGQTYDPDDSDTYVPGTVDREYLNHQPSDIYNSATGTPLIDKVNVVKKGTYYWVEKTPPTGYKPNDKHIVFEVKDDGVYYYDENNALVKVEGDDQMILINEKEPEPEGEVILTKTAKEKVGTTDIGTALAGAKFLLKKAADDSTTGLTFSESTLAGSKSYVLGSGTFNTGTNYLETGEDGKLHIKGLPIGDYYLEEQAAPNGYSEIDSTTGAKRRVYFSVGANRAVKEISATDEMAPAYIKLYEHINEKRDAWGNPTFVFKIKQTGYYAWTTGDNPEWKYTTTNSGKEILVALTVDDDNNITQVYKWFGADGTTPTTFGDNFDDPVSTDYNSWLVEGTTDLEDYQGIFDIDSKGRIRVEPGSYEITRLPVSRYEFVTNGKTAVYDNDTEPDTWAPAYTDPVTGEASEKMKVEVPKGKTIDVHYYDKVAYYDKFTQVDEEINKFYTLDSSKQNTTIKGIRIVDYKQKGTGVGGDTDNDGKMEVAVDNLTIYKIMSDGTEIPMTSTEKADISITYTYAADDDKKFGGDSENSVAAQFSYANQTITVTGASTFAKGVYTLNANYKGFTTSFDIVFLTASS